MIGILIHSCSCPEPTEKDAIDFVDIYGEEAKKIFSNINIEIRGGYLIDYKIDRDRFKLEENPKIKDDNIFLRFNNQIRFVCDNEMTFEEFCIQNDFDHSFYSLNYIHNDTLDDPKRVAFVQVSKLIEKLNEFGLQEVDGRLSCSENMRFFLHPRCMDYHVIMYVPDTLKLYPSFWNNFFKTGYSKKIKNDWYYYTYENWLKYSDIYENKNLRPKKETNPCFNE